MTSSRWIRNAATVVDRCRRLGGRRIVVLPYSLFTGVLPLRMMAQATAVGASAVVEVIGDCDAPADLVVERYREAPRR